MKDRPALTGALRGLTTRGRSFVAAGCAALACAILLGQRDLLRVGILVLLLPLVCAFAVSRTRYRLALTRQLEPARTAAGQESRVVLRLDNVSRLPSGLLLVEDRVPYVLGSRPRFVLDRVESRGHRSVSYPVRSQVRGRYPVGPLALRLADPFGMCELTRSFTATDVLTVTPLVQALPTVALGGEWSGSGESRSRSLAAAGDDDVTTREYRHGDPLHRVHWRSTARHGDLMVRREEQPWQSRATLLLDTRSMAHRGEGPGSSLEWAVSAAASIGIHLSHRGYTVRLATDTGASVSSAAQESDGVGGDFEGSLLDALAVVPASDNYSLRQVRPALRRSGDSLLVAVVGALDLEEAQELARMQHGQTTAVAVLLDVDTWGADDRARRDRRTSHHDALLLLARSGWRVVPARAGEDLPDLWPQAARSGREAAGHADEAASTAPSSRDHRRTGRAS